MARRWSGSAGGRNFVKRGRVTRLLTGKHPSSEALDRAIITFLLDLLAPLLRIVALRRVFIRRGWITPFSAVVDLDEPMGGSPSVNVNFNLPTQSGSATLFANIEFASESDTVHVKDFYAVVSSFLFPERTSLWRVPVVHVGNRWLQNRITPRTFTLRPGEKREFHEVAFSSTQNFELSDFADWTMRLCVETTAPRRRYFFDIPNPERRTRS